MTFFVNEEEATRQLQVFDLGGSRWSPRNLCCSSSSQMDAGPTGWA